MQKKIKQRGGSALNVERTKLIKNKINLPMTLKMHGQMLDAKRHVIGIALLETAEELLNTLNKVDRAKKISLPVELRWDNRILDANGIVIAYCEDTDIAIDLVEILNQGLDD